ncbi:Uncharacterized protein Adt_14146 [Abeliophyllum distichum]|uniref:Transposase MuDR plant domain-containing protein n=1 Tax=Abeliophyllum distichum TaxID=126358 RepID=A0ABD1TYU0_9LAMI
MNENDLNKFALCVEFEMVASNEDTTDNFGIQVSVAENYMITYENRSQKSTYGCLENSYVPRLPTIEDMGNDICESAACAEQFSDDTDVNIISHPSIENVRTDAIFKNKELLTTSVALHAIYYRFQLKVYKSDKSEYVLKCLDDNCQWRLRASILGSTTMFKIRKIKNRHTCSSDVSLGDHRQATCSVITNCIKYKFVSARTVYTTNYIVRDMMKSYGVSISYEKA